MKQRPIFLLLASVALIGFFTQWSQAATDSTSLGPPVVNPMTQKLTVSVSKAEPSVANPDANGNRVVPVCPNNTALIQVNNQTPQLYFGTNLWIKRKDLPPDFLMNQPSVLTGVYCAPVENVWIQK